jgi:hypothetical protein
MSKSSVNSDKHPYQKVEFWENPVNQFWEKDTYTEKGKEYMRKFVKSLRTVTRTKKDGRNFEKRYT